MRSASPVPCPTESWRPEMSELTLPQSSKTAPSQPAQRSSEGAPQRILIRQAAVLGAGVMGAQIAAHLANANVKPILFELAATEGKDKSAIARKAIDGLTKQNPSP